MGLSETYEVTATVRLHVQATDPAAAGEVADAMVAQVAAELQLHQEEMQDTPGCWVWVPGAAARELLGVRRSVAWPETATKLDAPGTLVLLALSLMAARHAAGMRVRGGGELADRFEAFLGAVPADDWMAQLVAQWTAEAEAGALALAYGAES